MRAERDGVKDFDMGPSLEEILAKCEEETGLLAPVLQEPLPWAKMESKEDSLKRVRDQDKRQPTSFFGVRWRPSGRQLADVLRVGSSMWHRSTGKIHVYSSRATAVRAPVVAPVGLRNMGRFQIPSASYRAGTIVLAAMNLLPSACGRHESTTNAPPLSLVRLGEAKVPAMICDFAVDPDHEVQELWAVASQPCILGIGWSLPTRQGVSASSSGATLEIASDRTDWTQLLIRVRSVSDSREAGRVEIRLNGTVLGSIEIRDGWRNLGLSIPEGVSRSGVNRIEFDLVDHESKSGAKQTGDRPKRSFQLRRLASVAGRASETLTPGELRRVMVQSPATRPRSSGNGVERERIGFTDSATDRMQTGGSHGDRPDIVLVILDAARPDHLSTYGYERRTTPNIDRLAEQSLVFSNAFALVPNTRRSVPTMVTGFSFINHQVTTRGSILAAEATTLAEFLREEGYRNACFTATPNNARSLGTDQGYDEFFELWTEAERAVTIDPHYLANRVVQWLELNDGSEPLHLQLHFVPPHAPYTPAPAFDLFANPDYEGPFDGFPRNFVRRGSGRGAPSETDLAHMIDRYDGNLRAADDALGHFLQVLRKRAKWTNTIVLVTSDHGEAFFEHGTLGHNDSVYDEALRVPFILRLPEDFEPVDIDLERLATLADIVPTLLAASDVPSEVPFDGENLLAPPPPYESPHGRYFVGRTAHRRPTRCLRTAQWKVVVSNRGRGELYDLHHDPREQHNLRFTNGPLFLDLGEQLRRRFLSVPLLPKKHREADVPASDREMLKALGYVD